MAITYAYAGIDVVEAARQRIINVFKNGLPVYMSFSGGKDSLVLADVTMKLIQEGKIDPHQLTVDFIDEEAIFSSIEAKVKEWRKKFLLVGAKFCWYCLEVRHYSCFNQLTNDESFMCWDRYKKDVWVRQPPPFAIRDHPLLKPREDTYQQFLARKGRDGITIVGIRVAESVQRLQNVAKMSSAGLTITGDGKTYPIYDWRDSDVWLYLLRNKIDIPVIYLYLWQTGTSKRNMRVSQFFSIDTARSLVKLNEYEPDLMDRIIRREPNAYLAALYWDSEMFGRSSRTRKELEQNELKKDYKKMLMDMFKHKERYFTTPHQMETAKRYEILFLKCHLLATEDDYKKTYEGLSGGDPKSRTLRALYGSIFGDYSRRGMVERHG